MTLLDRLRDASLYGRLAAFRTLATWTAWLVFIKAIYGLPLESDEERGLFAKHTGRTGYAPPPGGWPVVVAIVGRQSGKSRIASLLVSDTAAMAEPEPDGEDLYALLVAQDRRNAVRSVFRYACVPFERVPLLAPLVAGRDAETLRLTNGMTIAAYPCRPPALRGLRARIVVVDEPAYFTSTEGNPVDVEMLRAVRPCLATTGGKLVIISSPYGQSGALWELHRRYFGRDERDTLVWQASAPEMNPTLPADYLARMAEDDPEAYRSEVLGEFRAGVTQLFDPEALDAVVLEGERERLPEGTVTYSAGGDAASGTGGDGFGVGVAHRASDGVAILDACRVWKPPFSPEQVIAEAAAFLRTYRTSEVEGDAYAPGFVADGFQRHGIRYVRAERTRSDFYLELLPLVNAGRVRLLDLPDLLRELRGLERLRGRAGRDRVDHRRRRGAHDDAANSAAIALVRAAQRTSSHGLPLLVGEGPSYWRSDESAAPRWSARDL